jgi:hypothetical protein
MARRTVTSGSFCHTSLTDSGEIISAIVLMVEGP